MLVKTATLLAGQEKHQSLILDDARTSDNAANIRYYHEMWHYKHELESERVPSNHFSGNPPECLASGGGFD